MMLSAMETAAAAAPEKKGRKRAAGRWDGDKELPQGVAVIHSSPKAHAGSFWSSCTDRYETKYFVGADRRDAEIQARVYAKKTLGAGEIRVSL